jgi:hypothetical protein
MAAISFTSGCSMEPRRGLPPPLDFWKLAKSMTMKAITARIIATRPKIFQKLQGLSPETFPVRPFTSM